MAIRNEQLISVNSLAVLRRDNITVANIIQIIVGVLVVVTSLAVGTA